MSHQATVTAEAEEIAPVTFDLEEWNTYKKTHNKHYDNETEEKMRIEIFMKTKEEIAKHNTKYDKGLVSFKMGLNKFADLTPEERKMMC